MSIIQIEDHVERKGTHILVAMYGESGSGKTLSALLFGRGLAGPQGKLCLLDTENGRGRHYAKAVPGGYAYAELTAPFTGERYIESIRSIEAAGFDVVVIDSASHEWEGYGGVLEQADAGVDRYGKPFNGLIKWAKPKAQHKDFVQALLSARIHIVFCLRAKEKLTQVEVERNGRSVKEIISDGLVPIQEKRFKYEMTIQLQMEAQGPIGGFYKSDNTKKCPGDLLHAFPPNAQIGIAAGEAVRNWIAGDAPTNPAVEALRREGHDAAERGTVVLEAFWRRTDVKPHQRALSGYLPNWKSIAETADKAATETHVEEAEEDSFPGDTPSTNPAAPFGPSSEVAA